VQTPATHVDPDAHANAGPQPPQLLLFFIVLMQAFPQSVGNWALPQEPPHSGGAPLHVAVPLVGAAQAMHVTPHELIEVDVSLTHVPLQSWLPAGQTQVELWQTFPPVQAWEAPVMLQAPQLLASLRVLTSQPFAAIASQFPKPAKHAATVHVEAAHPAVAWGRVHAAPQALQLFGSAAVWVSHPFVTVLSQSPYPAKHDRSVQLELPHPTLAWASLQTLPQPPQLVSSMVVFTQEPASAKATAQVVGSPGGHAQTPATQLAPLAQRWPQSPQFLTSVETSTQIVEHTLPVAMAPQAVHAPLWHAEPATHGAPHPPQFAWSLLVSTHAPLHALGCAGGHAHTLWTQLAPLGQAPWQLPQWAGSVMKSTHIVPHKLSGSGHPHTPLSQTSPVGHGSAQEASAP
jgi:hypothetical protein